MSRSPKSSGAFTNKYCQFARQKIGIDPDLCDIKTGEVLFKYVPLYEKIEKITTTHIFKDLWLFPK
jgi:hypothetical protein